MSRFELRPYQEKIIETSRQLLKQGKKRFIVSAPTGAGKTVIFSFIVKNHIEKGGRVLVFTHRKELLKQTGGTFEKVGLYPELIKSGSKPNLSGSLHVSMVETFDRRKNEYSLFLQSRTLIIIDEAHLNSFTKIFEVIPKDCIVLGFTATPYRKGKNIPELAEFYEDLVQEIDTHELVEMGFLSEAKTYGVQIDLSRATKKGDDYDVSTYYEENKMWHGVVQNWKRLTPGTKTILFSSNVENSKRVCEEFNEQGFKAKHIDANTPAGEREEILQWFDKTPDAIVCNCGILTAGFDQPDIETVILYRATTSLPLFLQMCGRGSRVAPGKKHFSILDFGNNISRLGFWSEPRIWSLHNDKKRTTKEDAAPIKNCPECSAMLPIQVKICPYCEHFFEKSEEEKDNERIAELKLLTRKDVLKTARQQDNKMLVKMCKEKLINPFWVLHNKTNKSDAIEFCKLMGYKMPGFMYYNKDRFDVFRE